MDDSSVLHVCSFPTSDVYLFTLTHISVVEAGTNITAYDRFISVEDQVLLDPPKNVSLHITEKAEQLLVTWRIPADWRDKVQYELRYSYGLQQKTKQLKNTKSLVHRLESLLAGEVCTVQMRVAPKGYSINGHWSDWSQSAKAMCNTPDLIKIQCQWNEQAYDEDSHYTLFYKLCSRVSSPWHECTQKDDAAQCVFPGEESSAICVHVNSRPGSQSRIFYSEPFWMNNSVKTDPPQELRGEIEGGRLRLHWVPPFQNLSDYLVYRIRYHPQGEFPQGEKIVTLENSKTTTYLDVQAGSQYSIQIKAKPDGFVYNGFWSDWSNTFTVNVPSNTGALLVACIPFITFFISVLLIATFSKYFSKIKQHLWPPVPNLDKVLEGFLIDINQNCENKSFNIKQCYDDTIASAVEIVSEREALVGGKILREPVACLTPEPETKERDTEEEEEEEEEGTEALEASQDYVTLNAEKLTPCLRWNEYVYEEGKTPSTGEEVLQMKCRCSHTMSSSFPSSTDIFNQSYLLLAGQTKEDLQMYTEGINNQYTNLENMAQQSPAD
ncbi:hypothetical protein JZ751_024900 [Albula glossodonta]|uniref:Fibronectin type-III domain-containing protein n=1 Tax=Albula glossodonta TaxID=121402 RepID=A0A8T2PIN2_9TELE|nr:hypothetical protein JZ751_024900 [Albula glossodonta]